MLDSINPKTDRLGSGGFGSVFETFWKRQKVAIKVSVDVDIAIREVNILKYLQGIGRIPRLIDCEVNKEGLYLAQTLMKTSLASKESKEEFHSKNKFLDRLEIYARLADTFEEIHKMKVIHNDIKPHNLMLTSAMNDIYPIDFGVSKLPSDLFKSGSRGYCSPETINTKARQSTEADDVWSLAISIAEIEFLSSNHNNYISKNCYERGFKEPCYKWLYKRIKNYNDDYHKS